ncbi:BrnT family toxin [Rhodobacter sphaeroides]|jgi:hypothetical protein|uniref:BrnT family toxin n=1 Tax=Cereibacter sphaeroides (strain ATCC 17023 / DSM 158 / JCM 6121 / CCUG 31486 / LMG 2827 / NBRC 12203 / NCIMB 8253 / ATH 2.4.1.) TaxID=272943 RepID=Q3HKJ4_CERS4|nr:BrnT family toxin [Cereibacter sphaeroides]ABA81750.1 conserved hypothetical protein [Cereibacter sphaeroides 2.4.1]AXC64077.1 BrnT family toxin [Cereibacter sphaeroides 2.4.1]MVX50272.1 BrnT family toxin [Cereibacter sphaeroides]QHA12248.1 BrnT family toxin [Cereibacter sphaeroides]QHA15504.1 BrnT family toxin [Cereibacter sphaeroides]
MEVEFDEVKRQQNIDKHGIDLLYGALIFDGLTVEAPDTRNDYGEDRIVAIGFVDDLCIVTVYVQRGSVIRLISTRKGGRRDRRKYEEAISRRGAGA